MITREMTPALISAARQYPVVTITGPRQSGKTTLVRTTFSQKPYVSLEDPDMRMAAATDPRGFLSQYPEGAVLDEIQRLPALLSFIQGIVDDTQPPGMFILIGSHQPALHQDIRQSLAGRTAVLTLLPLSLKELPHDQQGRDPFDLIVKGAYPRLHENGLRTDRFYNAHLQTYVERDVRALINIKNLRTFQQFLILLAGRIGQVINFTALSKDLGVSANTIKSWIGALKASFVAWELPAYFENIGKRVVRSPKIYFFDTGLATFLLGIATVDQASRNLLMGALFENLILLEVYKRHLNAGRRPDLYFFRDTNGNEVDLIIKTQNVLVPVGIKSAATFNPKFLKGIERFRKTAGDRCQNGLFLYNGPQEMTLKGTRITNPFSTGKFSFGQN